MNTTNNDLEEWKQARSVLQFFDDKLHDLRKYGFSFLTALLTAESFLTKAPTNAQPSLPDEVKFAVYCVTFVLIVALWLLDTNYRAFQEATAKRAIVLEKRLNFELSQEISRKYVEARIARHVFVVYLCFVLGVLALGWSALRCSQCLFVCLIIVALLALVYMVCLACKLRHRP